MQKVFVILGAAALVALGAYVYLLTNDTTPDPDPASEAPAAADRVITVDFALDGLDGEKHPISEWDGKHRIINFWATWCAPCRREIPLLKAFQEAYGEQGFQVIGIAVEWLEPVVAYAEEAQFNYPILVGEQDAMAAAESSGVSFVGLPFTMIVTRDGSLVGVHMGEIHQEELDAIRVALTQIDEGMLDIGEARHQLDLL